jgi:mono/diheme cytochrome c family protein
MTGMPAWGATHSDDKIWAIVAFLRRLPQLTPAEYGALDRRTPPLPED